LADKITQFRCDRPLLARSSNFIELTCVDISRKIFQVKLFCAAVAW